MRPFTNTKQGNTPMKKQIIAIGSLFIACTAISCAEDAPEDRVFDVFETMIHKIDKAEDCSQLAIELEDYCTAARPGLKSDIKKIKSSLEAGNFNSLEKIVTMTESITDGLVKLQDAKCINDSQVIMASNICLDTLDDDYDDYDDYD